MKASFLFLYTNEMLELRTYVVTGLKTVKERASMRVHEAEHL